MKKLFNRTRRPQEDYTYEGGYDWDVGDMEERDLEEAGAEENGVYFSENGEEYFEESDAGPVQEYTAQEAMEDGAYYQEDALYDAEYYGEEDGAEHADQYAEENVYGVTYYEEEASNDAIYAAGEEIEDGVYYEDEDSSDTIYAAGEEIEDGVYYEDEDSSDTIYAAGEEIEDGVYYEDEDSFDTTYAAGEEVEDGVYYEDEDSSDTIYAAGEEIEDGVYYEDEALNDAGYYEDEASEEYYVQDLYPEEAQGYEESRRASIRHKSEGKKERKVAPVTRRNRRKQNIFSVIWEKYLEMNALDRVITTTGVAVLILALVTGSVYASAVIIDNQVSEFVSVGSQLEGIEVIGGDGLMAVADARMAKLAAAAAVEEEEQQQQKEYNEAEYNKAVTVKLEMVSVLKDLKIKFTNQETGKLVANVPFSVTITKPDGKSETWSDDDMDGIIYKKDITSGTYKVTANALTDDKYADYTLSAVTQSVEVVKEITYKKVDVKNEIKKESEVNVAKEDTKKNATVVESTLQDTVTWVESTATNSTYTEVSKSTIPDPTTIARSGSFMRMAAVGTVSGNNAAVVTVDQVSVTAPVGGSAAAKATASGFTAGKELTYSISSNRTDIATAAIDGAGNISITGVAAGEAVLTVTVNYKDGGTAGTAASANINVKVGSSKAIALDKTAVTVYLSEPATINAAITGAGANGTITAESSDTNVAVTAVNGQAITITGVNAGSAAITVKYTENGEEVKAACTVTVKTHPKDDKTTKLKDAQGNQLYVLENNNYREAVYADYYTASQFFIKGSAKYTGWQTIDGKVYYFDASGNKVTGEQVIQGAKYNFASDGTLVTGSGTMGIDVSKYNGNIDWNAVKNSGVSYVIIRCGYRGSSQGSLIEDPKFAANIKGATAAGLKVGVYFFTQALDEVEAVEEASAVLDWVQGYKISYPIFLDVEPSGGRGDKIDKATRTAVCKAFCATIQNAGYTAGIYANKTWLTEKIDASALSGYKIWLAQYAATPTYKGRYDLWQYKSTGKVSGISGNVDMNISYLGY